MASKIVLGLIMTLFLIVFITTPPSAAEEDKTNFSLNRGEDVVLGEEIDGVFVVSLVTEGTMKFVRIMMEYCPDSVVFIGLWPAERWRIQNVAREGEEERGRFHIRLSPPSLRHISFPLPETVMGKLFFLPIGEGKTASHLKAHWVAIIQPESREINIRGLRIRLVFPEE